MDDTKGLLWSRILGLFRLDGDLDREGTILAIREGVGFQGANVWALILAIIVASIGLNLNSTAVIIGAMLISPLMGPISGAGMALGIYDLKLLRRSLANLALMTLISLVVSTLYFWLSPLDAATAELLARTKPTFYDVLIALLGGAALMVGISRKSKNGNLLAGVAIATALMPPLCTAGFGLASRNLSIFAGAFYLYLINSVFIGMVAYLFSKGLRLQPQDASPNADQKKLRTRHLLLTILAVVVFVTPSVFIAYGVIQETQWSQNLDTFVKNNLTFPDTQVINTRVVTLGDQKSLEIALVGAPLSGDLKSHLAQILPQYHLGGLQLKFIENQKGSGPPLPEPPATHPLAADLLPEVTKELEVVFPTMGHIAWGEVSSQASDAKTPTTAPMVFVTWLALPDGSLTARFEAFVRLRLHLDRLQFVHEEVKKSPSP